MNIISDDSSVKIAVRERPLREIFKNNGVPSAISYHSSNSNILIADERPFAFDHVLSPTMSQEELFNLLLQPLVGRVWQGFHCTALAYGQTGTGKSFTMGLNPESLEGVNVGMIPRCVKAILECESENNKHEIMASFIEIYSEKVFDLLSETPAEPIIARGYKFTGGTKKPIKTIQDGYNLIQQGTKNRHVRPTKMNPQSSRSHAIFTIYVRKELTQHKILQSCLNLVDLAGSEGVRRTGHQGVALSEGVHINQGLLSIGKVLQAITHGYKVIPYRDSVLSSVLQDSLNPNSYFTLLACISPHREDLSETLSTLRFAQSAKNLRHNPQINSKLMELKGKSKTPYKSNPYRTKSSTMVTPTPCKRPFSMVNIPPTERKRNPTLHGNTFCTPNKKRKTENPIFNRTVVGLTPKEKQKIGTVKIPISKPLPFSFEPSVRESINPDPFTDSEFSNSRGSLMNLNISSSTAIDAPHVKNSVNKISSSYSPLVRKCVAEVESTFKSSMSQFLETLKNTQSIQKPLCNSSPLTAERQRIRAIIRQELFSIASEEKNDKIKNNGVNKELFCSQITSSPVGPEVKPFAEESLLHVSIGFNSTDNEPFFHSEKTVLPSTSKKPLRRSRRLSSQMSQSVVINDSAIVPRRRSHRLSLKNLTITQRRSSRLLPHKELPNEEEEEEQPQPSKAFKKSNKPAKAIKPLINNPTIASYFNEKENKKRTNLKSNLAKHQKAILEILNTGNMKELQCLPQIGLKTAFQIVTQRTLHGKFKSFNHLGKLPIWRGTAWERFKEANSIN